MYIDRRCTVGMMFTVKHGVEMKGEPGIMGGILQIQIELMKFINGGQDLC